MRLLAIVSAQFAVGFWLVGIAAAQPAPLPEQPDSTIGYPTVDAALAGLHAKPGVVFSTNRGWTIAVDETSRTIW